MGKAPYVSYFSLPVFVAFLVFHVSIMALDQAFFQLNIISSCVYMSFTHFIF